MPIDTSADFNDIDSIIADGRRRSAEVMHQVGDRADALFTWDYEKGARPGLDKLYEKAKVAQWNGQTDLPWDTEVDIYKIMGEGSGRPRLDLIERTGGTSSPFAKWDDQLWADYQVEELRGILSQFLHGEQGALLCTAKICETVPWIDAKYYAATQVMDEARHVEVFAQYLDQKLGGTYPINPHLQSLLDDVIDDDRWDITYLGMQIVIEGLALAAFGGLTMMTQEPLLKKLLRYVMSDEARHVAFGVLSLKEFYDGLSAAEIRERQEFCFEASVRMRNRYLSQEVWERLGVDVRETMQALLKAQAPDKASKKLVQNVLFSKIIPNCKKLGLLDAGDGWLRDRYTEMGVIHFEDDSDTSEEYALLDEVSRDRAATA